jgi:poly-gamma-glutamate capsule biosynthesis protein CapA/YwtB (metallophosphatase superfamily)
VILLAGGDIAAAYPLSARDDVWELVEEADVTFANLESPLTDRGYRAEKAIALQSAPAMSQELAGLGLDVLGLANNHACDYGIEGLLETMEALESAGVRSVGAGRNISEALQPAIFECAGIRLAFLSFSCTLPPGFAATSTRPGVAPIRVVTRFEVDPVTSAEQPGTSPFARSAALDEDVGAATNAVAAAKARSEIVVVGIHWGVPPGWMPEFQGTLAEYQRPLGHALVDAGADIVVGHHPHCLHGVEAYAGGWIAFSTGNLLFHPLSAIGDVRLGGHPPYRMDRVLGPWTKKSALLRIGLGDKGPTMIELIPLALDEKGEPKRTRSGEAALVMEPVARHCEELGAKLASDGSRFLVTAT